MAIRTLSILSFLVVFLFTMGCDSPYKMGNQTGLRVTGKVGEILVVCDQGVWDSEIKHVLDSNLTQWIMPYLPDVATFQLVHRTPEHFTQGIKRYRNTLFLNIDPNYQGAKGSIVKREDVWAV